MMLQQIQSELKVPKGQLNKFGGYKYRSCEDILEALKPVLAKYQAAVTLSDDLVQVGTRIYIKATATLKTPQETISTTAFAREAEQKKGMDESQLTGSASSYARKYALSGLFGIDDTKDADAQDNREKGGDAEQKHLGMTVLKQAAFMDPAHAVLLQKAHSLDELRAAMEHIKAQLGDSFQDVRALYVPIYKKREKELSK